MADWRKWDTFTFYLSCMGFKTILQQRLDRIAQSNWFIEKKYRGMLPHVELIRTGSLVSCNLIGISQTRGQATARMVLDSLRLLQYDGPLNFRFYINDKPGHIDPETDFYYCLKDAAPKHLLFPDFAFDSWPEAGINNYTAVVEEMKVAGTRPATDPRLFWIGNKETNPIRSRLIELGGQNPDQLLIRDTYVDNFIKHKRDVPYVSLPDHTQFKYLLDVEGNSYSARLKFLFFSGRVVFLQERKWKEYFHDDLEPYVHYVPVKADLSDLISQYEMMEKNPDLYRKIAANALEFAERRLSYHAAINYLAQVIDRRCRQI